MSSESMELAIDRSSWPAGPWDNEPDREHWIDEATGLDCLIVRNRMGALCGYVGVPTGHPWHGLEYSARVPVPRRDGVQLHDKVSPIALLLEATKEDDGKCSLDVLVRVHGGLTYADHCQGSICHTDDEAAHKDVWWLGFDCSHCNDATPCFSPRGVYRDIGYVRNECTQLAAQVAAAA